jgi:hypothetical protein
MKAFLEGNMTFRKGSAHSLAPVRWPNISTAAQLYIAEYS